MIDVADFNDADKLGKGKEMVDRLSNLVSIFNNPALHFRGNRAEGEDILGDASKGFMKDGNKNRLRAQDIHKIVDAFTRQLEIDRYSRMVPLAEISDPKNDFNLNLPRYIDSTEPEDLQDIDAHLRGGIPSRDI